MEAFLGVSKVLGYLILISKFSFMLFFILFLLCRIQYRFRYNNSVQGTFAIEDNQLINQNTENLLWIIIYLLFTYRISTTFTISIKTWHLYPRERGNIGLFITLVPQSFIITFSYSLAQQLWGHLLNFNWLVH